MRYEFKGKHKIWFNHRWVKPGDPVELTEEEYERLAISNPLEPLDDEESDEGEGDGTEGAATDLEIAQDLLESGTYQEQRSFLAARSEEATPSTKDEVREALEAFVEAGN
jgi:hypothetical protein